MSGFRFLLTFLESDIRESFLYEPKSRKICVLEKLAMLNKGKVCQTLDQEYIYVMYILWRSFNVPSNQRGH